jgi:hypothetical protein
MVKVKDEEGRKVNIPFDDFWNAANARGESREGKELCKHFLLGTCRFGNRCRKNHSSSTGRQGSPRRGRSKKRSRSRDRRRERSRSLAWGERSGATSTHDSGDWESRSSGQMKGKKGEGGDRHHTYKTGKGEVFMNSYLGINLEAGSAPEFLSGDWMCPGCGDHQFAQNKECRMCNAPRWEGGKKKGKKGKKGGKKGDKEKGKSWGKGKGKVKSELDDYEEDTESDSRSPSPSSTTKDEDELWSIFNWDTNEWGEREEELMGLPYSWKGLRTYREIMKRAKALVAIHGGDRKKEATLLVCPGCLKLVGGINQRTHVMASATDAEQSLMTHLTGMSCNEALSQEPSYKHKHMKPGMFEQVKATYIDDNFREERDGPRGGGTSSGSRDTGRTRMVRIRGGATDRDVKKGRKLKGRHSKKGEREGHHY